MEGNCNRDVGKNGNGNEVLDWEWDGNRYESTEMGANGNNNSHSGTALGCRTTAPTQM